MFDTFDGVTELEHGEAQQWHKKRIRLDYHYNGLAWTNVFSSAKGQIKRQQQKQHKNKKINSTPP